MRLTKKKYLEIDIEVLETLNISYDEKSALPVRLISGSSSIYLKRDQLKYVIKALQTLDKELK